MFSGGMQLWVVRKEASVARCLWMEMPGDCCPVGQGTHLSRASYVTRVGEIRSDDDGMDDEAHFWLNGYVNKQNCRIWSEANPQVYVETPLHPEKLTVWCALWAGGILQNR
ncbi:hypothetical protein TNCV_3123811 [Trichonephila clavipes]|nr:hypothetical protein TNCV_3123811 [Trichonephila clavipes]